MGIIFFIVENSCSIKYVSGRLEIVLTTYESFRDRLEDLNAVKWTAVIVDEAHRIKESKSRTTMSLKSLRCKRRIGLTVR